MNQKDKTTENENLTKQPKLNIELFDDLEFSPIDLGVLELAFFSVSRTKGNKTLSKDEKQIIIDDFENQGISVKVEIISPRKYGIPVVSDLTKYIGFLKIVTDRYKYGNQILNPIEFSSHELIQKSGLAIGGRYHKEVAEWLLKMSATIINLHGKSTTEKKGEKHIRQMFEQVVMAGSEDEEGKISDLNRVWLTSWATDNICKRPLLPIDLETYHKIKNDTAKLLITHLQSWLFASRNNHLFTKSYASFCEILNIKEHKYPSKMKQQLSTVFKWLEKYEYVEKWWLQPMRSKEGFKVCIVHGKKFYRDLKQAYTILKSNQAQELPFELPSSNAKSSQESLNKRIDKFSEEQTRFYKYLLEIPLFKASAIDLIESEDLLTLKRKTLYACEVADAKIAKGKLEKDARAKYIFAVIQNGELPENYLTPEETKEKQDKKKQREKQEENKLQSEREKQEKGRKLLSSLSKNKLKKLREKFAAELQKQDSWKDYSLDTDDKANSIFIMAIDAEIRDYLLTLST